MNGREKGVERQFASADLGSAAFDMEFSWKHVCYTRARFPKYFFTVCGLALLVLSTVLFVRNQGKMQYYIGNPQEIGQEILNQISCSNAAISKSKCPRMSNKPV